ncbi:4234_t:CDS:2, partial [Dentiscutata heterogama]
MFEKKKEEKCIFPTTSISELQDRPFPKTSACLVIGDEILDGKTVDSNSGFFAKFCFNHGIYLKRIEVIPDKEDESCSYYYGPCALLRYIPIAR